MLVNDPSNNYHTGYIKLFRSLKNHWIWEKGQRKRSLFEAWVDLLLKASHTESKLPNGFDLVKIEKGQILTSQDKLSKDWLWDRNSVRRYLLMLQEDKMINIKTNQKYTIITICNYDSYQSNLPSGQHKKTNRPAQIDQAGSTYNNVNELITNDKVTIEHFHLFWKLYQKSADKDKCEKKFMKLEMSDVKLILANVPEYVILHPEKKYRKNPLTYLNGKCWLDEIETAPPIHIERPQDKW